MTADRDHAGRQSGFGRPSEVNRVEKYAGHAMHKPPPGPEQSLHGIPFVMTNAMNQALRDRRLSEEEIANLTPAEAHEILGRPNSGGQPTPGINGGSQSPPGTNNVPVTFLERLRPGGRWLLITLRSARSRLRIPANVTFRPAGVSEDLRPGATP
jgi:hypothetical protein